MTALLLILTQCLLTTSPYFSPDLSLVINVRGNETWAQAGCITIDLGGHTRVWTWLDIQTAPRGTHTEHKETLMT